MKCLHRIESVRLTMAAALVLCLWTATAAATNEKESHSKKPTFKKSGTSTISGTKVSNSMSKVGQSWSQSTGTKFASTTTETSATEHQGFISDLQNYDELVKLMSLKRKECKNASKNATTSSKKASFFCERLKWNSWLLEQLKQNTTRIIPKFVKLVKNPELSEAVNDESAFTQPENWGEKVAYSAIEKYGEPVDKLLFYQFKKYTKSRELQVSIPKLLKVRISPRTHQEGSTGRTLFDPGFNLKLKFPFFKDELKVAVSTGPSFLAGLGVGLVVLGIKSLFSPLILAVKYYILSFFFKHLSPFDFLKAITGHFLPWGGGGPPEEPLGWIEEDGGYEPPVHNSFDYGPIPDKKSTYAGGYSSGGYGGYDQSNQFSQVNPIIQQQNSFSQPLNYHNSINSYLDSEARKPDNDKGFSQNSGSSFKYVPPALQLDVENFDPFYSPLLSRIDSIFMHLGFTEEGCKEQAVCSIYKFPVKYAPYSNLLSAQLSKHQSELKRPVTTSPKVLRYFKYMKAAKDGQAALNCIELYPNCTNDTEKLSNLPMVKTFQQLTELMGTGSGRR